MSAIPPRDGVIGRTNSEASVCPLRANCCHMQCSKQSPFFARAFETQCCLRANLKPLGCDFSAAPHTLSVGAILNSHQRSLHRGDLARDERGLPFEGIVILHLDRLFGGIGIKRLGQIPCNATLPSFEFGELHLETGFGDGAQCSGCRCCAMELPSG